MLSSQRYQVASWKAGWILSSPLRTACTAALAMLSQFTYLHVPAAVGAWFSCMSEYVYLSAQRLIDHSHSLRLCLNLNLLRSTHHCGVR